MDKIVDFVLGPSELEIANTKKEFSIVISKDLESWEDLNKNCPIGEYNKILFTSGPGLKYFGLARVMGIKKCLAKTLTTQDILESIHGVSNRKEMYEDLEYRYKMSNNNKFIAVVPDTEIYIITLRINEYNLKTLNNKYKNERIKSNPKNKL